MLGMKNLPTVAFKVHIDGDLRPGAVPYGFDGLGKL
jgi:hypothetical protein